MNYTLHQIEIFVKIAELGSFSKAAKSLYLTQPAVSIQFKKFQEQFDSQLIELINKKVSITPLGQEILPIAKEIMRNQEKIKDTLAKSKGLVSGKIKISSVSTGKYLIPFFLKSFLDKHSGIDLEIDVTNRKQVISDLVKNNLDFALVSLLPNEIEVESIKLMENQLNLIGCADAQYNENHNIEAICSHFPLIYREEGSATKIAMKNYFSPFNIKTKTMELVSNEAVKQSVIAGIGCSIMPIIGLKHNLESGELRIIPRKNLPVYTSWHIIWLKKKKLSFAANAYIEFLKNNKDFIIEQNFSWRKKYY